MIRDLEAKILKLINTLNADNSWKLAHVLGPNNALKVCELIAISNANMIEDLCWYTQTASVSEPFEAAVNIFEWAYEIIENSNLRKKAKKNKTLTIRSANRAQYLPYPVFNYYEATRAGNSIHRFKYDYDLRSAGLMAMACNQVYGLTADPVAMGFINTCPKTEEGQTPVPSAKWDLFNQQTIAISGERLGWNMKTPAWQWLTKLFPQAIDLSAYNHSLNAPVLPEGFISKCPVYIKTLTDINGVDLETDGSGWYHPETPELQAFTAKYGTVPIQIRFINQENVFAKGMLFPCLDSIDENSNPIVTIDWRQIKGVHKQLATTRRVERATKHTSGFLGIIQCWNKPGMLTACFEILENFKINATTISIVKNQVAINMKKLVAQGVDGLIAQVSRDDEQLRTIIQLVTLFKAKGSTLQATQIPRVRKAVTDALSKRLWDIANGAGIKFNRYVCRLDNTIPRGKCVVSGIAPGTKIVGFRVPMVLTQGLVSLETIKGPSHLYLDTNEVGFQVVMNPNDLITKCQGDDDGDIMGISTCPQMIELFKHIDDTRVFHIEPEGIRRNIASDSIDGLQYLRYDQRGEVGRTTIYRSRLKAINDLDGANAMSLSIQESIDKSKRIPEWSDFMAAANPNNWNVDANGEFYFDMRLDASMLEEGDFPIKHCSNWVKARCKDLAGVEPKQVLGWKWPNKRIPLAPGEWKTCIQQTGWDGGNLVHIAHDHAHELWQTMKADLSLNTPEIQLSILLPALLSQYGYNVVHRDMDWEEYLDLRKASGLTRFGQEFSKIMNQEYAGTEKFERIKFITRKLQNQVMNLTLVEVLTCWVMELEHEKGNINNAFRVVAWPGSPVMSLLGIEASVNCQFLNQASRIERVVKICLNSESPHQQLSDMLFAGTKHGQEIKDQDGIGIETWECKTCVHALQTALVQAIRKQRQRNEHKWLITRIIAINNTKQKIMKQANELQNL